MAARQSSAKQPPSGRRSDPTVSYNEFKEYEGRRYTGMQTANDYTTSLHGIKFKIAHKRADRGKWSATPRTQRKRMITFLRGVIAALEKQVDRQGDALVGRQQSVTERRNDRATRRPTAKPATSMRQFRMQGTLSQQGGPLHDHPNGIEADDEQR